MDVEKSGRMPSGQQRQLNILRMPLCNAQRRIYLLRATLGSTCREDRGQCSLLLVHRRDRAKRAPVQVPDRAEAHAEFAAGVYMMGEPGEPKFRTATRYPRKPQIQIFIDDLA